MHFLELFITALLPVLKLLLNISVGSFLAMKRLDILGKDASKHLNTMVFFVFTPALMYSNMAETITFKSMLMLWYMPLNALLTFISGTALGWLLIKIIKTPDKLHGLVLGFCSSGNLGMLPLVVIPAVCKGSRNLFGAIDVCHKNAMGYAALSLARSSIYLSIYTYNLVRIYSCKSSSGNKVDDSKENPLSKPKSDPEDISKCSTGSSIVEGNESQNKDLVYQVDIEYKASNGKEKVAEKEKIRKHSRTFAEKLNLKSVVAPSTIGTIIGLIIGITPLFRKVLVGKRAPLRVVQDSASMVGDATIPASALLVGANLLKGLKGSDVHLRSIVGIIVVRNFTLPIVGICIIKGVAHFGLINHNPLYQFALLLQFAVPPAISLSTFTQLFGVCEGECAVIMLATYAFAIVSLALWSTFFMWLVQ